MPLHKFFFSNHFSVNPGEKADLNRAVFTEEKYVAFVCAYTDTPTFMEYLSHNLRIGEIQDALLFGDQSFCFLKCEGKHVLRFFWTFCGTKL